MAFHGHCSGPSWTALSRSGSATVFAVGGKHSLTVVFCLGLGPIILLEYGYWNR